MDIAANKKSILQLMYLTIFCFIEICQHMAASDTRVVTTAPVSPVLEGEILSVHCQVWNLQEGQDVTLFRTSESGLSIRVALIVKGEALIAINTGTVFVAVRQMHDGSVVHFLSILGAMREDAGEYGCKIEKVADTDEVLPRDSVNINVAYFPSDSDPTCSSNDLSNPLQSGDRISLFCDSEEAFPVVTLQWTRSGSAKVLSAETTTRNGRAESVVRLQVNSRDNGKIFTCRIRSRNFPGRTKECHIGPLTVLSDGTEKDISEDDRYEVTHHPALSLGDLPPLHDYSDQTEDNINDNLNKLQCSKSCASDSSVIYWILATVVTAFLAFIFLILGMIMIVKYYKVPPQGHIPKTQYIPAVHAGEEIYVEVDCKRRDKSMYMSLEKPPRKPELMNYPSMMAGEM